MRNIIFFLLFIAGFMVGFNIWAAHMVDEHGYRGKDPHRPTPIEGECKRALDEEAGIEDAHSEHNAMLREQWAAYDR